jgi:hypothetical protein
LYGTFAPKFQGKIHAAAMILCGGKALTGAGSILNLFEKMGLI